MSCVLFLIGVPVKHHPCFLYRAITDSKQTVFGLANLSDDSSVITRGQGISNKISLPRFGQLISRGNLGLECKPITFPEPYLVFPNLE